MTAPADLIFGDWIWAVFPQITDKWRPGVFVGRVEGRAGPMVVAIPATAEAGHRPGALAVPEPPLERLRACRLVTTAMSVLRHDRIEPLGASLSQAQREDLSALIVEFFTSDWRAKAAAMRQAPARLRPRSTAARRR